VPGVVTLAGATADAQTVAINVDIRESSLSATTVEEFTQAIERTNRAALLDARSAVREMEDRQRWWQIGLMVMLVALAGEALIGRRAT
jgi:hypothetical protein